MQERIPIYLAAIGPKNTQLAGEIADGWLPTFFSPEHVGRVPRRCSRRAPRRGGRTLDDSFDIAPNVSMCIDDDVDRARDALRPILALYVGGMGSRKQNFYNALVRRYGFEEAADEVQELYLSGKKDEAAAALPAELIDITSLCGPRERIAERLETYKAAGVGTLITTPLAATAEERAVDDAHARGTRLSAGGEPRRFLLAAFGEPGHAFPMIALGRELAARGHSVCLQTWDRWQEHVEREGMRFERAPEYAVFPTSPALKPYQAAVRAAEETVPLVRELDPRCRGGGHPHAGGGAGGADGGAAVGDARAPRAAGGRARLPALLERAPGCRARRSGGALWRLLDPLAAHRRAAAGATS